MKPRLSFPLAIVTALMAFSGAAKAAAFQTYQSADVVLGQPDFISAGGSNLPNRFSDPGAAAVDPTTGKVFVADYSNNRVLRFSSTAAAISGSNPEAVIGQVNFTSSLPNQGGAAPTANTLTLPTDVFVDAGGRLWVADSSNHRVLRFDLASWIGPTNPSADIVLGQPNFTTANPTISIVGMTIPYGLTVDGNGVLWVADLGNSRVLRFNAAVNKSNGASADGVLGQASFMTSTSATSIAGMRLPGGVSVDASGRLWVADTLNHRVLRFDSAASKANGANANGVLGQPDFNTGTAGLSDIKMDFPLGVYADASGNLWVGEFNNRRATRFGNAASLADGSPADLVLGQPDFFTQTFATTARGGGGLYHIAGGPGGSLLVSDSENSRVLRYTPVATAAPAPIATVKGKKNIVTSRSRLTLKGTATNAAKVEVKVGKSKYKVAKGTSNWRFKARLMPGKNLIRVRAISATGAPSPIVKITASRR